MGESLGFGATVGYAPGLFLTVLRGPYAVPGIELKLLHTRHLTLSLPPQKIIVFNSFVEL